VMVPAAEVDGDEGRAGFDEPPRQERALPPAIAPVFFAQPRIFRADVERPPRRGSGHEIERLAVEAIEGRDRPARIEITPEPIERLRQPLPVVQTADRQVAG